jgi:hypothetical protein
MVALWIAADATGRLVLASSRRKVRSELAAPAVATARFVVAPPVDAAGRRLATVLSDLLLHCSCDLDEHEIEYVTGKQS